MVWLYALSNTQVMFGAQFMKKLSKLRLSWKKSVAYKKTV